MVGSTEIAYCPDYGMLAFSDFGDLYLYYIQMEAGKCFFNKGGSFDLGSRLWSQNKRCEGLKWSFDCQSLVFKYIPNVYNPDSSEIYEIDSIFLARLYKLNTVADAC